MHIYKTTKKIAPPYRQGLSILARLEERLALMTMHVRENVGKETSLELLLMALEKVSSGWGTYHNVSPGIPWQPNVLI